LANFCTQPYDARCVEIFEICSSRLLIALISLETPLAVKFIIEDFLTSGLFPSSVGIPSSSLFKFRPTATGELFNLASSSVSFFVGVLSDKLAGSTAGVILAYKV